VYRVRPLWADLASLDLRRVMPMTCGSGKAAGQRVDQAMLCKQGVGGRVRSSPPANPQVRCHPSLPATCRNAHVGTSAQSWRRDAGQRRERTSAVRKPHPTQASRQPDDQSRCPFPSPRLRRQTHPVVGGISQETGAGYVNCHCNTTLCHDGVRHVFPKLHSALDIDEPSTGLPHLESCSKSGSPSSRRTSRPRGPCPSITSATSPKSAGCGTPCGS
jgi:hypothetical protein